MDMGTQPYALAKEEGQAVWFLGTLVIMKATGAQTAGQDTPAKVPGGLRGVPRGSGRTGQGAEHTASGATRHGETDGDRRQVRHRDPGTATRQLTQSRDRAVTPRLLELTRAS